MTPITHIKVSNFDAESNAPEKMWSILMYSRVRAIGTIILADDFDKVS